MDFEVVIGLEVHAQLLTRSKMFCPCAADYAAAPPNTRVCPICLGMPGVLPAINRQAVEFTIMTALALNCSISPYTKFDRKNYPYPDLMKGYQISQYDAPIGQGGWVEIEMDGTRRRVDIQRVHLEEDVAKLFHRSNPYTESYSLVDVNRSGVPLMEVVSQPDLRSPEEARQYLVKLRSILQYLGVSTGSMEEGSFRCDANISLRLPGAPLSRAKVEVKNMNSFKAVFRALEYEAQRQRQLLEQGGELTQETRGWVEEKGVTVLQRTKEYAHDYRYFPEPDLPPLHLSPQWVEEVRARLPELPEARRERFLGELGLSAYDATLLTEAKAMADYFEACLGLPSPLPTPARAKKAANWLLGDFNRLLNATDGELSSAKITPDNLIELIHLTEGGKLSGPGAKAVFEEMFRTGRRAGEIMAEKGLVQISGQGELEGVLARVVAENPQAVADYKKGKAQALTFLMGQVMKESRGRANPNTTREMLTKKLEERE